jgi:hypothetical protein
MHPFCNSSSPNAAEFKKGWHIKSHIKTLLLTKWQVCVYNQDTPRGYMGRGVELVEKSGRFGTLRRTGSRRTLTLPFDTERTVYGKREKSG